jgi:hypothetical protein
LRHACAHFCNGPYHDACAKEREHHKRLRSIVSKKKRGYIATIAEESKETRKKKKEGFYRARLLLFDQALLS